VRREDGALTVAFLATEVAIRSNDAALVASLRDTFRLMPGEGRTDPVAQLTITANGETYDVSGTAATGEQRANQRSAIRWARQQVLEAIIAAHPELLWLHAAVAGWKGDAVMIPGVRGRGKSTLVTALCERGATFLTDDILPLDPATLRVLPFPRVPEVRDDPGEEMPAAWLLEVTKTEIPIDDRVERAALPVRAIILPQATRAGGIALAAATPAEAVVAIAEGCWNFADHGTAAGATLSRLVSGARIARLSFDSGTDAAAVVLDWLARAPGRDP
jgi:hypothetical protein